MRNDSWQMAPLGDIADVALSGVDKRTDPGEIQVRLCNYLDVYNNRRITRSFDFMEVTASRGEIERFTLQHGDILITKDSETPDDIGIPALVAEELDNTLCGYHLALIRPTSRVHSLYLQYQLQRENPYPIAAARRAGCDSAHTRCCGYSNRTNPRGYHMLSCSGSLPAE